MPSAAPADDARPPEQDRRRLLATRRARATRPTSGTDMRRGLVWCLVAVVGITVLAFGATLAAGHTPLLGLDLKGGVSVVLQPQGTANSAELNEAVSIIERRVNGLGVANSDVARQGGDVVINLPGIKDAQGALKILGETATLYFRPVYCLIPAYAAAPATTPTTTPSVDHHRATTDRRTAKALGSPASDIRLTSAAWWRPARRRHRPPTPATTIVPAEQGSPVPVGSNFAPSANDCSASNAAQLPTHPGLQGHGQRHRDPAVLRQQPSATSSAPPT